MISVPVDWINQFGKDIKAPTTRLIASLSLTAIKATTRQTSRRYKIHYKENNGITLYMPPRPSYQALAS
jgi:hypothetical protein